MFRPPYSDGIFIPKQPSSARPFTYSSGICASRSMTLPSIVARNSRSWAKNFSVRSASSSEGLGNGLMSSSGNRPRKSSLAKDGLSQPLSRDSSATALACSSLTCACCAMGHSSFDDFPGCSTQCYPPVRSGPRFSQNAGSELGVEFPGDGFDHVGDSARGFAVRVATLTQLGLHGALQQGDHVLDHPVQLIRAVLVFGRAFPTGTGQGGRRVDEFQTQCLGSTASGSNAELNALPRFEAFDARGQRRGAD